MNLHICLYLMMWCHFVDDFFLQSCLANLKQKAWWKQNYPQELYKHDYIMALLCHSTMWAISIMIPTMIFGNFIWWIIPINAIIHFIVDDLKTNKMKINLATDQSIHLFQVYITCLLCVYLH